MLLCLFFRTARCASLVIHRQPLHPPLHRRQTYTHWIIGVPHSLPTPPPSPSSFSIVRCAVSGWGMFFADFRRVRGIFGPSSLSGSPLHPLLTAVACSIPCVYRCSLYSLLLFYLPTPADCLMWVTALAAVGRRGDLCTAHTNFVAVMMLVVLVVVNSLKFFCGVRAGWSPVLGRAD